MRAYSVSGQDTSAAGATMLTLISATTIRPSIYDVIIGSVATPADNAAQYYLGRVTAAGTVTAVTPQALDPGNPSALASAGVNASAEPTYTANAIMLRVVKNQRATFRWVARERGEILSPATAANGIGVLCNAIGGSGVSEDFVLHYSE